jgi:hypothetical protein
LKNTHLLRYAYPSSLRRTGKYDSFLRISRALHLDIFDQPEKDYFFNNPLDKPVAARQRYDCRRVIAGKEAAISACGSMKILWK